MEQSGAREGNGKPATTGGGAAGEGTEASSTAGAGDRASSEREGRPGEGGRKESSEASASGHWGVIDFTGFILSLAQSVLIDLGVAPHPETGEIEADLKQASHTIDILDMLQQKTRGNLSPDEEKLLERTLYQLRLSFVEVKHRQPPGR